MENIIFNHHLINTISRFMKYRIKLYRYVIAFRRFSHMKYRKHGILFTKKINPIMHNQILRFPYEKVHVGFMYYFLSFLIDWNTLILQHLHETGNLPSRQCFQQDMQLKWVQCIWKRPCKLFSKGIKLIDSDFGPKTGFSRYSSG